MALPGLAGMASSALGFGDDDAAKDAKRQQTKSNKVGTAYQKQQYEQTRQDLSPYRVMGQQANPYLMQATLGGDLNYWMNQPGMQPGTVGLPMTGADGKPLGQYQQNAYQSNPVYGGNVPNPQEDFNNQFSTWQNSLKDLSRKDRRAAYQTGFQYTPTAQPQTATAQGGMVPGVDGGWYPSADYPQGDAVGPTAGAPPTGMSPGLQEIRRQVDRLSNMNTNFSPQGLPETYVGSKFSAPVLGEYSIDRQKPVGYQAVNAGNYGVAAGQVNQDFTEGRVDPRINVDLAALQADPIYQFILSQGNEAARRGLAAQGLVNSRFGADVLSDNAMRAAAAEVDRYYGRQVDEFNRTVGNEDRLFRSQQAGANLGLANVGNQLQAGLASQDNALRAALANQSAGLQAGTFNAQLAQQAALANQDAAMQSATTNAMYDWGAQQAQYGMDTDNYNRALNRSLLGYDVDVANYGRGQNALADYISQLSALDSNQYNRLAALSGTGQNAAVQQGTFGQNFADNMSNSQQSYANSLGSIYAQQAQQQQAQQDQLMQMAMMGLMFV